MNLDSAATSPTHTPLGTFTMMATIIEYVNFIYIRIAAANMALLCSWLHIMAEGNNLSIDESLDTNRPSETSLSSASSASTVAGVFEEIPGDGMSYY